MALSIIWTRRAEKGFDDIIEYLEKHFTEREISIFIQEVEDFLELLKIYPELSASSVSKQNVRRGPINSHTMLTYRINYKREIIELINMRSTRKKPQK